MTARAEHRQATESGVGGSAAEGLPVHAGAGGRGAKDSRDRIDSQEKELDKVILNPGEGRLARAEAAILSCFNKYEQGLSNLRALASSQVLEPNFLSFTVGQMRAAERQGYKVAAGLTARSTCGRTRRGSGRAS